MIANDSHAAAEAIEQILEDDESLPVVIDPYRAVEEGEVILHSDLGVMYRSGQ